VPGRSEPSASGQPKKRAGISGWRIVGIIVGNVLPLLGPAQPSSPIGIFSAVVFWVSVHTLAKAIYRKMDLRTEAAERYEFEAATHEGKEQNLVGKS
jgi:hypothetical protein